MSISKSTCKGKNVEHPFHREEIAFFIAIFNDIFNQVMKNIYFLE
jgi:hypothetical protein